MWNIPSWEISQLHGRGRQHQLVEHKFATVTGCNFRKFFFGCRSSPWGYSTVSGPQNYGHFWHHRSQTIFKQKSQSCAPLSNLQTSIWVASVWCPRRMMSELLLCMSMSRIPKNSEKKYQPCKIVRPQLRVIAVQSTAGYCCEAVCQPNWAWWSSNPCSHSHIVMPTLLPELPIPTPWERLPEAPAKSPEAKGNYYSHRQGSNWVATKTRGWESAAVVEQTQRRSSTAPESHTAWCRRG